MRCKTCDYRLWNLTSRQCPECGTPFLPSDYEFTTNSVQFQCPHCNQSYYGTGAKGHLVPAAFSCVGCDKSIHMNEMVLLPTEGLEEEETKVERSPWLERKRIGTFKAWFRTVWKAMIKPAELIGATPVRSSLSQAMWFALLTQLMATILAVVPVVLIQLIFVVAFLKVAGGGGPGPASVMGLGMLFIFVFAFVGTILSTVLWGLVTHLVLRLTGQTTGGLGRTYHVIFYSSGANAVSGVPFVGGYFGWLWWLVSSVLMLRRAQGVGTARAIVSVTALPLLVLAGFGVFMWVAVIGTNSWATQAMRQVPNGEVQTVVDAVVTYAADNGGESPSHAIRLLMDGQLDAYDLVTSDSFTGLSDVPVGAMSLETFDVADDSERESAEAACVAALPPETIAHRLGDFVFTYHGMDLGGVDGGLGELWVVVRWDDPDATSTTNATPMGPAWATTSGNWVWVGLANGEVRSISTSLFDNELERQNELRKKHGLAALPHPEEVTHDSPAVGTGHPGSAPVEP